VCGLIELDGRRRWRGRKENGERDVASLSELEEGEAQSGRWVILQEDARRIQSVRGSGEGETQKWEKAV